MDTSSTPTSDSNSSLSTAEAGAAFAEFLDPVDKKEQEIPTQSDAEKAAESAKEKDAEADEGAEAEPAPDESETITVMVDGKPVELTKAQISESYKDGLRQADYTRKTQDVSDQRKAAEAETFKAQQERQHYAQSIQRNQVQLESALQEQNKIDWAALLDADPVEYLKQQHLVQTRQAAWQQNDQQMQHLKSQYQAEQQASQANYLADQRSKLTTKIPEWSDPVKQAAGIAELKTYLINAGYAESDVMNVDDHRAVVGMRKAMLYDQMMSKASAAAKKVANLPQRVERPSGGNAQGIDQRSSAFQRLSKSGSVSDAAAVFSSLI